MQIKTSNQTDSAVYADAIMIRKAVFITEQHIDPALELDQVTDATWHYVGYTTDGAVTTARMTPEADGQTLHIQRVATLADARGHGYARALLTQMIADARQQGYQQLTLGAQVTAQGFYTALGFQPSGEPFTEAGLPHQTMTLTL